MRREAEGKEGKEKPPIIFLPTRVPVFYKYIWLDVVGAKDKKGGGAGKQTAGKTPGPGAAGVNGVDDDVIPRALQLELSVRL